MFSRQTAALSPDNKAKIKAMFDPYIKEESDIYGNEDLNNLINQYNDEVIYPDKVRLNLYYYNHYSFWTDIKMIFATVLGKKIVYAGEEI